MCSNLGYMDRNAYPSDVTNEEWAFLKPYLTLMTEESPQRKYSLREVFNGLRWIVRAGAPWRMMLQDLPLWQVVYQQAQRLYKSGVFADIVHDLRVLLRLAKGKQEHPTATIFDGRTLQSTPKSEERAGCDGYKRTNGSKVHMAVDTLGYLLVLKVTPANGQEHQQVSELASKVQAVTDNQAKVAFVDQGYTGEQPSQAAQAAGVDLIGVKEKRLHAFAQAIGGRA